MKPTYKNLEREIEELRQALTGRTMSCAWCNDTAKQRDEAIRERDEVRAMMVTLCHRVVDAATREERDDDTN